MGSMKPQSSQNCKRVILKYPSQRVFHTQGLCQMVFEYVGCYQELISKYQHLNRRFYELILPHMQKQVTLYHSRILKFQIKLGCEIKSLRWSHVEIIYRERGRPNAFKTYSWFVSDLLKNNDHKKQIFGDYQDQKGMTLFIQDCCQVNDREVAIVVTKEVQGAGMQNFYNNFFILVDVRKR